MCVLQAADQAEHAAQLLLCLCGSGTGLEATDNGMHCRCAAKNKDEANSVAEVYFQLGPDSPADRAKVCGPCCWPGRVWHKPQLALATITCPAAVRIARAHYKATLPQPDDARHSNAAAGGAACAATKLPSALLLITSSILLRRCACWSR